MSDAAIRTRAARRRWAEPGSRHDQVVKLAKIALPLAGAGLLPLSTLERGVSPQELAKILPKDKIIYCYCLAGGRCAEAAAMLKPLGYDVRAIKPGYPQLVKAGFPAAVGK